MESLKVMYMDELFIVLKIDLNISSNLTSGEIAELYHA